MTKKTDFPIIAAVYESLNGELSPRDMVPGVENAFDDGAKCERLYAKIYKAERRLEKRLGIPHHDDDVERIIQAMLDIQKYMCFKMYYYGATIGLDPVSNQPKYDDEL